MLRSFLLNLAVALIATSVWAQGDQPDACSFAVSAQDETCSQHSCDGSTTDCGSRTFTVSCQDVYHLKVSMVCKNGDYCGACDACAFVYDANGMVANSICHLPSCAQSQCSYDCSSANFFPGFELFPNTNYTLYVCQNPCGAAGAPCCAESCTAAACV
jgi:hypothetical protein